MAVERALPSSDGFAAQSPISGRLIAKMSVHGWAASIGLQTTSALRPRATPRGWSVSPTREVRESLCPESHIRSG